MEGTDRFRRCHLGLLALMWAELDSWVVAIEALESESVSALAAPAASIVPAERIEAFLLELAMLYDCPDSFVLRRVLRPDEVDQLRGVVGDVWRLLDVRPFESSAAKVRRAALCAQDRLFEELQALARTLQRERHAGGCDVTDALDVSCLVRKTSVSACGSRRREFGAGVRVSRCHHRIEIDR